MEFLLGLLSTGDCNRRAHTIFVARSSTCKDQKILFEEFMFMVQRLFALLAVVLVAMSTAIAQPKLEIVGGEIGAEMT